MESTKSQARSGPQHAVLEAALERFGQLLRAILIEFPAGASVNNQLLSARLVSELDRWLRDPAAMPPWWQNLQMAPPFAPPPSQSGRLFDPVFGLNLEAVPPLIAQNDFTQTCQRLAGLMKRWSQLQAQLAMHWSTVARNVGERFIARAADSAAALDLTTIRKLYDGWIECAEQAYAATVHTDDFCRTQAELVNITTALLLEQRQQVERFAPMFGLATRSEVDALRQQVRRNQNEPRPSSGRSSSKRRRRKGKTS
jgi:Poly(R)-hydroxyalkanoic acid synthase subunit (PHA_synth_III_E)